MAPFRGGQPKKVCKKCGYGWGWSPDSTKLIYGAEQSISVLDLAASRQYKVIDGCATHTERFASFLFLSL